MTIRTLALAVVLFQATTPSTATRPDFSGEWALDLSAPLPAGTARGAMLGERFTAKQDATTLALDITAFGRRFPAVYHLDGSDSVIMSPTSPGQPDEKIVSKAAWEGNRLVIRTRSTETVAGKPVDVDSRRSMWIDSAGRLILERTGTPPDLVPASVSAYRKVK